MAPTKILTRVVTCALILVIGIADNDRALADGAAAKPKLNPLAATGPLARDAAVADKLRAPAFKIVPAVPVDLDPIKLGVTPLRYSAIRSMLDSTSGLRIARMNAIRGLLGPTIMDFARKESVPGTRSAGNLLPAREGLIRLDENLAATNKGTRSNGSGNRQTLEMRSRSDQFFSGSDSGRPGDRKKSAPPVQTTQKTSKRKTTVAVLAHPLLTREITGLLRGNARSKTTQRQLDPFPIDEPKDETNGNIPFADVYVVDAYTHRASIPKILAKIREKEIPSQARIIVLASEFTEDKDKSMNFRLLNLGVKGLIRYDEMETQLLQAVYQVLNEQFWFPGSILERFVTSCVEGTWNPISGAAPEVDLTRREMQVLNGVLGSLANKEIAAELHLSERTVKFHVSSLLAKFKVRGRMELAKEARRIAHNLFPLPSENHTVTAQ